MTLSCVRRLALCLVVVLLGACGGTDPAGPGDPVAVDSLARGVYILCEGLWKYDNSTLTRYDPASGRVENNVFAAANPGLRLGDTGNDLLLRGDTAYVAVTVSRTIEIFRASTGRWLQRIRLDEGMMPRRFAETPAGVYISNYTANSVSRFDPDAFSVMGAPVVCGPAVEGLVYAGGVVWAANSGLGALQIDSPLAGTLSVIPLGAAVPETTLTAVPNVVDVLVSPDGQRLYALSREINSRPDLKPTIIEYNVATREELRRWQVESVYSPCFSRTGDSLLFISNRGVESLDLRTGTAVPQTIVVNTTAADHWYALAVHPEDGTLWIGNARGYTTEGEVIIADSRGAILKRFDVGINPTKIAFFGYE